MLIPEVHVVGKHQVNVLVVLAGEHSVLAVDLSWKDGHAFVLSSRTIERNKVKQKEIEGFHQLRYHDSPIECREGRVIDARTVVVQKRNEPRVLDAIALRRRGWK